MKMYIVSRRTQSLIITRPYYVNICTCNCVLDNWSKHWDKCINKLQPQRNTKGPNQRIFVILIRLDGIPSVWILTQTYTHILCVWCVCKYICCVHAYVKIAYDDTSLNEKQKPIQLFCWFAWFNKTAVCCYLYSYRSCYYLNNNLKFTVCVCACAHLCVLYLYK